MGIGILVLQKVEKRTVIEVQEKGIFLDKRTNSKILIQGEKIEKIENTVNWNKLDLNISAKKRLKVLEVNVLDSNLKHTNVKNFLEEVNIEDF